MSRKDDEVHTQLGREHVRSGMPRYRYQDQRLQELYDRGYNDPDEPMFEPEAYNRHRCQACGKSMTNTYYKYCSTCRA